MPNFLIHNGTISQSGSKMEQCNSLLPRHPCPFCCHLPWFMVLENCLPFNQYLQCHTLNMHKDEKVNNPRCDKGGRKGILILCMMGRSTVIDYLPKLWAHHTIIPSPRPTVVLLSDCWPSRSSSSTTWWRTSLLSGCGWMPSMSSAGER